jgi:cellulose synthase/poly-beta-1,6-N-acetylglucosamine synthase-like glycosyltransferase
MRTNATRDSEPAPPPLVTILVPSYNHEKYVVDCLDSIRDISYPRLELIVSDDCSLDATFARADQWVKGNTGRFERALVVRQDRNVGIVRNLQYLFNQAQGDYLAYIASDDMFVPSAITCRVQMLQDNPHIDALFGNAQLVSSSGKVLEQRCIPQWIAREFDSPGLLVSSLILNWRPPGPVMMLRRQAVLENGSLGLLPDDLSGEDKYIYVRLAARGKLRFIDMVVAQYRVVEDSLSRAPSLQPRVLDYHLRSDQKNRPLLSGFNRWAIEARMARVVLDLNKADVSFYEIRKLCLRCLIMPLKMTLFACALISGVWTRRESDRSC